MGKQGPSAKAFLDSSSQTVAVLPQHMADVYISQMNCAIGFCQVVGVVIK